MQKTRAEKKNPGSKEKNGKPSRELREQLGAQRGVGENEDPGDLEPRPYTIP